MNVPEKLLIDVEKTNNVAGYQFISKDGIQIQYVISGKIICPIPENERDNKIYKLLEENCDLIFLTTDKAQGFPFYPVPTVAVFAFDSKGNRFGTIGGMGGLGSDEYPIGYINQEGVYGKIASSVKEFLELVTFYPYWRDIVEYEQLGATYNIADLETKQQKSDLQLLEIQFEIAEILKLSKNPHAIELLLINIKSQPDFVVYGSKDEAKKVNTFLEDLGLDEWKYLTSSK